MINRPVGSQSAAGQWCSSDGIQAAKRGEIFSIGNKHTIAVSAVCKQPGFTGIRADHFVAIGTLRAGAAPPGGVKQYGAQFGVDTGDLMTQD